MDGGLLHDLHVNEVSFYMYCSNDIPMQDTSLQSVIRYYRPLQSYTNHPEEGYGYE